MTAMQLALGTAWGHIVDAVLAAATGDEAKARQELARAERIMHLPEQAHRAVLGASLDDAWAWDSPPYMALEEKYNRLLVQYHEHLESDITGLNGHIEDTEHDIEALRKELDKLERDNP